jgi:hypothetical protein
MDAKDQDEEGERRTVPHAFNGQRARSALVALVSPAAQRRLVFDARETTRVDAYAAAVLRTAVELHLARKARNSNVIVEPASDESWAMLYDLLGEVLPARCAWAGTRPTPTRGRRVVLPATTVIDDDVELITDHALRSAAGALRFGDHAGRLLQESAAAFLENARTHGTPAEVPPVICAAFDRQTNDLQLVVCDLGRDVPTDGQATLHSAVAESRANGGGIQSLAALTRGRLDFSVRLAHGTGRAHYRTNRSWHFSAGSEVPGYIAGIEIHQ